MHHRLDIMAADITTADVYEDASLIGQDIEKIIDRFGHDAVMDLMPKVIRVLEKLEVVVGEKEKDKLEIAELKLENERLYLDIKREASQRRKLDEELYQISATGETDNLKAMLIKLQEENKKLRMEVEVTVNTQPATAYISAPGDAELMEKMKETIDNQRDSIRSKNKEIDSLRTDLDAVEEQIVRLTNINESVRKTLGASKDRIHDLAREKAELQTELRALRLRAEPLAESDEDGDAESVEQFMNSYGKQPLENHGSEDDKEGEALAEDTVKNSDKNSGTVEISTENPPPKPPRLKVEEEGGENVDEYNNNETKVAEDETEPEVQVERKEKEVLIKQIDDDKEGTGDDGWEIVGRSSKKVLNGEKSKDGGTEKRESQTRAETGNKDPNRPRYTKAEMLEVLTERNKLKEQVFALQDELKIYKPGYTEDEAYGYSSNNTSPRRVSRREESGISRIFSIFTRKGEN